ncbi:MAG: MG2 domain-containing protein, partial [Bacteroidota bacterium]
MNLVRLASILAKKMSRRDMLWKVSAALVLLLVLILSAHGWADNAVRLVRMDPSGEVSTRTNFTFFFSADVVPKSRVGKLGTTDKIKFNPPVPGKIRWDTTNRLRFFPEAALRPSTPYTVEFAADLPGELKKTLAGNRRLQFTTERFRVTEAKLNFTYNPQRARGVIFQARLSFNYPVAADSLQRSLKLCFTDNRQPIRFTVQMANGGRDAVITSELLQRGRTARKIELSLPEGFLCLAASTGLKERYAETAVFQERRTLAIDDISPLSEGDNAIRIRCSEPVDPETAASFISLKPAAKYQVSVVGETITLSGEGLVPGQTYEIKVAKGLPSLNGDPLPKDFIDRVTFPDLEPSVGFNSPGRYLSSKGQLNLGLETVNISQVELEIAKVYANNIVSFLGNLNGEGRCYSYFLERVGRVVERQTIAVNNDENKVVTTPINLGRFLADKRKGIFQVVACDPENRWRDAAKVVIVTDLGILAKFGQDELVVWVNSLDTLAPKPGTRVSLVSYNNQEIAAGVTDANGVVRFSGLRQQIKDYRSYLILAELEDDLSFVCLDDSLVEKTDFAVNGRPHLTEGYEAYLYADRGVFRPGDTANLAAMVRGANAAVPPEFPLRLEIVGPDGMVFREFAGSTRDAGLCQFELEIPDYARTGKYNALLYAAKQPIGGTSFSVEDFMPDRIKVETATDKDRYARGETATIKVRGVNLFGPPAAGRRVDLSVRLEPVPFSPPAYRSYTFGDPEQKFRVAEETLGQGELDRNGQAGFSYDFPDNLNPPGMIRAVFQATVTEEGGRAVSNVKTVEYHPRRAYIGIRSGADSYAKVGEAYPISLVEVDQDGQLVKGAELSVEIFSVTWNSIYRRDRDGRYTYHSERQEARIGKDTVKLAAGEGAYTYRPGNWGCYKIVFADQRTGARGSCEFYATGWGYAPWAMDHPDRIQLDLDKTTYKPGETASVQIKAPFAGRALVTVEREKVYDVSVVELKENTGVIAIPVKEEYKPNVYVSIQLIRAVKQLDKRAPTRAFGTIPLGVDCSGHKFAVEINAAGEIRPNQRLEVEVAAQGKSDAYLTLAAVDEGICQLTEFLTPDPWAFFYGKRSLGVNTYDLYGMLLPEVEGVKLADSPAGDEDMEGVRRRNLNPVAVRRVKPVSLWSGLVKLDSSGRAKIKLDIPQFNGTLRLMAVAASGTDFGAATKKILVRDPIVMTSTYPRFAAPGDRFVIPVSVFNGTGRDGAFKIKLGLEGPADMDGYDWKDLTLADKQEKTVNFAVIARQAAGKLKFILTAEGNGARAAETTELAVRPAQPFTRAVYTGVANAGKAAELSLPGAWLPGTAEYSLSLAPIPALKFTGGLRYLLGYPYGCIEQTTSKLFPLLYLEDLARIAQPDLFVGGKADRYIAQGIEKLESMQLREGGFSYWPGGDWCSDWGSIYAANFLVEAREAKYTVADRVYDRMLGYLDRLAKKRIEGSWSLQLRVYALYVLALAGKPDLSSMAYIKSQRLTELYLDSRAQLAAAYYYAGDKKTARELMPATFAASTLKREKGGNFNSNVRADAIILGVLADVDPAHPAVPKLIDRLSTAAKASRWGTTQENAFAFMALGKLLHQKQTAAYTGEVLVDGQRIATFDSKAPRRLVDARLGKGKVTVKIAGAGDCYLYAEANGVPLTPVRTEDNGLTVRREFFDRTGQRVDLNHLKQGDLLVARIYVKTAESDTDNVAIVDLLPAGLEIENPRLASSAKIGWLSADTFTPSYMDIRDDRLMLFASFDQAGTRYFYYAARVVSCGTY